MNAFVVVLLSLGAASAMQLGYQKGQRYTYCYQCEVTHAIPGSSEKSLGLRVKCQAHVDVHKKTEMQITLANIQVHQVTRNRKDPKQQQENAADSKVLAAMEQKLKLPVRVSLKPQDGSIKEIAADPQDVEWSQNIKRGLANLFQISPPPLLPKTGKQYVTQHECTAIGDCQVSYVIDWGNSQPERKDQCAKVTKVFNYEKCRQRPEFSQNTFYGRRCEECKQSTGYAPYHRSAGQIDHTLTGSQSTGYIINRTEAFEQHVITPFSQSGGQVTALARQILQFQNRDAAGPASTKLTKKISQAFVAENPEKCAREDGRRQQQIAQQAKKCIDEMCKAAKDPATQQAAQKFSAAVQQLRKCSKATLETLANQMSARQDQTERKFCLDALSFVGTREAFSVLKQQIENKKINKPEELKRVFLGLASAPRPTADHVETAWEMCNHAEVKKDPSCRRHCLLSFGALVYKINQRPSLLQDTKTVTTCQQHIKEMVDQLADQKTSPEDRLMYIKVLGNTGSSQARKQLQNMLKDQQQPLHVRVECVWALRRIAQQAREKAYPCLISIFADPRESPELRMAIFVLMLNSELNFATLQALANTVRREITNPNPGPRSNQLASFVISHLSALAYHNNVLTKKRSMQARMALRLMPRMSFGLGYSKGIRFAQHSEKFQAGFELEANKLDVPESMLPRNFNARLQVNFLGYKMNPIEFGARIENMDDVIEDVISQVRRRHKRSLWGSLLSLLGEEASDRNDDQKVTERATQRSSRASTRATGPSTKGTSRPTSHPTSQSKGGQKGSTRPRPTYPTSDGQTKQRHVSAFMKLYGNEVKFMELKQETVDQLAKDVSDLISGKKDKIDYTGQGIVITHDGMEIEESFEKAFLDTNARRMLPTLCGISLDMQFRSAVAVRVIAAAKMTVAPSLLSFWNFQKITGAVEIKPNVDAHVQTRVGIHTPFLYVGVQMNARANANADQKVDVAFESGKEYKVTYNVPQGQRDIVHMKANTQGLVEERDPVSWELKQQVISMEFNNPHLRQVEKTCYGQNMFGVQLCAEGHVPDFPSLRLQQVPVLPAIGQTEVRVSMAPATDNPSSIQWNTRQEKNDNKEACYDGEILASSNTVHRRIPYRLTYKKAEPKQLEIDVKQLEVKDCENCRMKITANHAEGWKLEFGREKLQYQITTTGEFQNQGKGLRLQAKWTELPEEWKNFFYKWEPQIWYAFQQFAWIRRTDEKHKQVAFEFQLTSPVTADLRMETPDAVAERTDLSLPLRVDCLPTSLQDIKNFFYAKCEVQDQSITVFDQLQYQHNIRGGCPYVLAQDHRKGKQSRFQLTVKIDKQGRKTVMASIQLQSQHKSQQSKETVQINPDSTILIDGQKQECSQQACQSKQASATVRKVQMPDGNTQIQLSTKLGLHATIQGQRIQVYASPLLRSRVRGLCGDADGEQWNEYKDPQGNQQQLQKFIQSWQQQC